MSDTFSWGIAVGQLLKATQSLREKPEKRFNPRPPGVIRDGSATEAVLAFLTERQGRYFTNGQLMQATNRSHGAVSWALLYLRDQGLVDCVPDASRNERFLKYSAQKGATDARKSEPRTEASTKRLAHDETPLLGAGVPVVRKVRGQRNSDLPAVDGVWPVPARHGTATEPRALAGQARHEQALHPGKHDLDAARPADAPAPVLPQCDRAGPDDDSRGGGTPSGLAVQEQRAAPLGCRVQSGAPQAGQGLQALDVAHAPGRDAAAPDLGAACRAASGLAVGADQARNADRAGTDTHTVPPATRELFHANEAMNATAA